MLFPLHDILPNAHGAELQRVENPNHPAFQHFPDEVDIIVNAGDLVIGDSRLLHASHGNQSDEHRTVITDITRFNLKKIISYDTLHSRKFSVLIVMP